MIRLLFTIAMMLLPSLMMAQASGGQIKRNAPKQTTTPVKRTTKTVDYSSSGKENGHEYVDLGLSVKWAMYNVGANSPEQYGHYYAWGDLYSKSNYTVQSSKTYNVKMNDISGNPQYDVARYKYGGTWRMPTKSEFNELIEQCKWTKTKYKNVFGYNVTGPNGKSIFLPFGGEKRNDRIDVSTNYNKGFYWTSTPLTKEDLNNVPDDFYNIFSLFVHISNGPTLLYSFRQGPGMNIRPICD